MSLEINKAGVSETQGTYEVGGGRIYAKTIEKRSDKPKTALFIHGGGSGGNHTIVERPSYWMLQQGMFSKIIMPDRRGAGNSSPLTQTFTHLDYAQDMKRLLSSMNVTEQVAAIGVSYGGPIALTLAGIDERIDSVYLVASSPALKPARGLMGFLYRQRLLERLIKGVYGKIIGTLSAQYGDFDGAYDAKNEAELKQIFFNAIKRLPKDRFDSLLLENASTCALENRAIAQELTINVPVYRVIGTKDETWEGDCTGYVQRIPNIKTCYIKGAAHKDVFFRAGEFYKSLLELASTH